MEDTGKYRRGNIQKPVAKEGQRVRAIRGIEGGQQDNCMIGIIC